MGVDHLGAGITISGVYAYTVDLALIAILPIAFYPFFGGKIWCRYWCPAVGLMNLFHRAKPKSLRTFGIASRKERCIACGMCDRFCEVHGKRVGALAETVGDRWRQYSPKGRANTAREKQLYYVTGFAIVATVLVALGVDHLGASISISGAYAFTVDLALIAILPIAFYPFFGGKG